VKGIFVTGIGTDIGKTVVSSILVESLHADYWKPVQAGNLDYTDSDFVKEHISNANSKILSEVFRLNSPMSPHAAARIDEVTIELNEIDLPLSENLVVAEGAGGIMVPLNDDKMVLDLMIRLNLPVILVSENYLGSINHTLLSINTLKSHGLKVLGVVFNGKENLESQKIITDYGNIREIGRIDREEKVNKDMITHYANKFKPILDEILDR